MAQPQFVNLKLRFDRPFDHDLFIELHNALFLIADIKRDLPWNDDIKELETRFEKIVTNMQCTKVG